MAFKKKPQGEMISATPEELFAVLPRTRDGAATLWSHQADILRSYSAGHKDTKDLAIELPTGTGKTLTGLLVAEWSRRSNKGRTIFACPTKQLVKQVISSAQRQGIAVVDLSGSWRKWDATDQKKYEAAESIAVVSYSSIFNSSPKLGVADMIVLDDAHAGEQYVSKAFTLNVNRFALAEKYEDVLDVLKGALSREIHAQMISRAPDGGVRRLVEPIYLARYPELVEDLDRVFTSFVRGSEESFQYSGIRGHLQACAVYVSWNEISIRPLVSPTFENGVYADARQRIYLSATLGSAGELERAFGRRSIKRLTLPTTAGTPKSGRRFIVFPQHVRDAEPAMVTQILIEQAGKAIILTPSENEVTLATGTLVPEGWNVFYKGDIDSSFDEFAAASEAVCVLANRYDGLDLPGDVCHAVVLAGHPNVTSSQERFLTSRARAGAAIAERIRSRVTQGTGRCTRGPGDWALVIVSDLENTNYLSRAEVQSTMDVDLQSEIRFGLEQSDTTLADMMANVADFLRFGETWHKDAEPILSEYRSEATRVDLPAADGLSAAAALEVDAAQAAWHYDWDAAAELENLAAEALNPEPEARSYKAVLHFVSAVYTYSASIASKSPAKRKSAVALADKSVKAASPGTWMKSMLPLPGTAATALSEADQFAVLRLVDLVGKTKDVAKHQAAILVMKEELGSTDHKKYEPGLTSLGRLLGADASRPVGDGRCDSAWCWGNGAWVTLEAKSEHGPDGRIGLDDMRQVNEQLKLLGTDRSAPIPPNSASLLISPRMLFKEDALVIAESFTYKMKPTDFVDLAAEVDRLWLRLLTLRNMVNEDDRRRSIVEAVADFRLLPGDLMDRFTWEPIVQNA
jgi:hypothetical protein